MRGFLNDSADSFIICLLIIAGGKRGIHVEIGQFYLLTAVCKFHSSAAFFRTFEMKLGVPYPRTADFHLTRIENESPVKVKLPFGNIEFLFFAYCLFQRIFKSLGIIFPVIRLRIVRIIRYGNTVLRSLLHVSGFFRLDKINSRYSVSFPLVSDGKDISLFQMNPFSRILL